MPLWQEPTLYTDTIHNTKPLPPRLRNEEHFTSSTSHTKWFDSNVEVGTKWFMTSFPRLATISRWGLEMFHGVALPAKKKTDTDTLENRPTVLFIITHSRSIWLGP